jgi:hypothetical protein
VLFLISAAICLVLIKAIGTDSAQQSQEGR